ncbi:MAG TPA: M20 family metallopeptidase, partial [Candidatus Limnocylindrales bacterium]|nr:M20 family metallopeptidase [Candidatus Limnocylindrales bacterium]
RLVNVDCGSYTKAGVDEVGRWVAERMRSLGADVRIEPNAELGDTVVGRWTGDRANGLRLLLIGHMDTVVPEGTAAERPFGIDADGIARGPGVTDMKAGLLAGLYAVDALRSVAGALPLASLTFVANPDEEIGSPVSTPVIRSIAAGVDACLVLECARANGDIVSSRKGIEDLAITVRGRAAHAGVEPEKGRSAILEAARIVRELHALNGRWAGVTVNVGVIAGGIRPNVVAETCRLEVDLRAIRGEDLDAAEATIREICARTEVPDVSVSVEVVASHRPMEKLEASGRLVDLVVSLAGALGFELRDAATGGASDANTTAGMGIPTIDGLGPIGGLDHSPDEYLEVSSIVPRTTLLAALIVAIARDLGDREPATER